MEHGRVELEVASVERRELARAEARVAHGDLQQLSQSRAGEGASASRAAKSATAASVQVRKLVNDAQGGRGSHRPTPRPAARRDRGSFHARDLARRRDRLRAGACVLQCRRTRSAGSAGAVRDGDAGRCTILRMRHPEASVRLRLPQSGAILGCLQLLHDVAPPSACLLHRRRRRQRRARPAYAQPHRADRRHPMCKSGCRRHARPAAAARSSVPARARSTVWWLATRRATRGTTGWRRRRRRALPLDDVEGGEADDVLLLFDDAAARAAARRGPGRKCTAL